MFYHVLSCSRQANRDRKRVQCKLVKPLGLINIWLHSSSPGQLSLKIQRAMLAFHSCLVMCESLETRPKQSKTANFANVVRFLQAAGFDEQKERAEERRSDAAKAADSLQGRWLQLRLSQAPFQFLSSAFSRNPPGTQESL